MVNLALVNPDLGESEEPSFYFCRFLENTEMLEIVVSEVDTRITYYYVNPTNQIQVIRITNIPNWYFEKVVFPKQRLMFEAAPEALLEVHTGIMASSILSDKTQCHLLCVKESVTQLHRPAKVA